MSAAAKYVRAPAFSTTRDLWVGIALVLEEESSVTLAAPDPSSFYPETP
ncbi:MAG: hypothetical protein V2A74_08415 [bacterium]